VRRIAALTCALAGALAGPAAAREAVEPGQLPPPVPVPVTELFPIDGRAAFGKGAAAFGGARHHRGHDLLAACGTPIVAALAGQVTDARYEGAAGNYAVVRTADGTSQVYMHLREPARLRPGEKLEAGDRIGSVGDTGDARGCHLHFEFWTAPGWFAGGHAVDPLARLHRWHAR
jgi:murein DD-endopeptidase MepM/ murein hydrolase activator NlpD